MNADPITVLPGDCLDVLRTLADNSVDSCVTDPPYGLNFMGKEWDRPGLSFVERKPIRANKWDHVGGNHNPVDAADAARTRRVQNQRFQEWCEAWAREVYRVLKPGAHVLAFGGTRTHHRLACAIEDAGFEIRDSVYWTYGSGFPKSHDVSKGIDRAAGAEREVVGRYQPPNGSTWNLADDVARSEVGAVGHSSRAASLAITAPATPDALRWQGWGTALKPAVEPICMARKPLSEKGVAANVLRWGTGALNIDGCRVQYESEADKRTETRGVHASTKTYDGLSEDGGAFGGLPLGRTIAAAHNLGRWPANLIHDGSEEVLAAFPETTSGALNAGHKQGAGSWGAIGGDTVARDYGNDTGSAARFFKQIEPDELQSFEEVAVTWISELEPCQAVLRVATGQLLPRATVVSASSGDNGWSTFLSGNTITELFRKASSCIIRTATSSTTESRTWSLLTTCLTSAFTGDVKYEAEHGGSLAENVGNSPGSIIITLAETAYLPGANHAASGTRLKISVSVNAIEQSHSVCRLKYTSKADSDDRLGASHPTVKPVGLMQYLVRLVCPPGGIVLDCFAGTGTTGEAAVREGMRAILIERDPESLADIERRLALLRESTTSRRTASLKARGKVEASPGPLFDLP